MVKIYSATPIVIDNAPSGWSSSPVTVTLTADDTGGPGMQKTQYRAVTSGSWTVTTNNQFIVPAPSDHSGDSTITYQYRGEDTSGTLGDTYTCTVNIDTAAPTVTDNAGSGTNNHAVTVTLNASDSRSGIAKTQYRVSGSGTWLDDDQSSSSITPAALPPTSTTPSTTPAMPAPPAVAR